MAVAAALSGAAAAPSSTPTTSSAPQPAATEVQILQIPALPAAPEAAEAAPTARMAPIVEEDDLAPSGPTSRTATAGVDSELECLAKVVLHEAGNQSRTGQAAVAEVVMNRLRNPRFPKTICGVVMQRGQFFNVHAYNAQRDPRWSRVVEIARSVRDGEAQPVTNGAHFFRSGGSFPGRTRVATIGAHAFYR